jgi:hypothetical protein
MATGLTTCILKDGTQTLTAMIPFTLGLSLPTDKKLQLRDSAIFINSSADGQLNMAADTSVTITTPSLIITDNTTDEPIVQIKNTHNGTTAGELRFVMDKGSAGADGDDLGTISFYGDDSGQNQTAFAKIVGEVSEADNTDEAGKLSFYVAESDGTNTALTAGLVLEGEHATDGEVDVTIGAGAASTTTIVGNLSVTGASTFNGTVTGTAMVHLNTTTISTSTANVIWNSSLITTTYSDYIIRIHSYEPVTDSTFLRLFISTDNGSNFVDGNTQGQWYRRITNSGGNTGLEDDNQDDYINVGGACGNDDGEGSSFIVDLIGLTQATNNKYITYNHIGKEPSSAYMWNGGAMIGTTSAINYLKLQSSSGNITQGTFSLYGMNR